MQNLPLPDNEVNRIEKLHYYNILDSESEDQFDNLTKLVAEICDVPMCLISLVDSDRQWFKSKVGLDVNETPREISFCQYAIMSEHTLEVNNPLEDDRFKENPLVTGSPKIRFYSGAPLIDQDGLAMGTICVMDQKPRELNEFQKNALESIAQTIMRLIALRKSNQQKVVYSKFFNMSLNLLCIAGVDGFFKYLNPMFSELLGWNEKELKSRPFIDFVHPNDVQKTLLEVEKLASGIDSIGFENRYRKKDGEYIWLNWNCRPDSNTGELFATARNINDNKNLVIELKEAKHSIESHKLRLENVINGTNLGTWEWNVQSGETVFNERWAEIIGYTLEELEPISIETWMNFAHPDDLEKSGELLQKHFTGESDYYDFSSRMKHRDGHWIWVWDRGVVMSRTPEGEPLWMYGTHQEITDQKELEDSLKKAKNMAEESAQAKEAFLANISHEIRTPLNAIIGFSDLLTQTSLDKVQSNYAETIGIASKNLLGLINDVLDLSKIESGVIELERKPIDLNNLLQSIVKINSQAAKEKDLKIMFSMDQEIPDMIIGDPTRISQILVNLIGNAIKFTPKGFVEIKVVAKNIQPQEVEISFSVRDTGIGVAKEKLDLIFDRFAQAENSTTREYGGTGLGLSIVKKLVEMYHSRLRVTSEIGKGTEFSFDITFPIAEKETQFFTKSKINSENPLKGLHILLAEDNEHNQILASTYLRRNGAIVDLAENGDLAVDLVRTNTYDLILMDLQMPKVDGFEATKIIRKEIGSHIPIVACTAHSLPGEKKRSQDIGMNDYITKPFTVDELVETILRITKGNENNTHSKAAASRPTKEEFKKIIQHLEAQEGRKLAETLIDIFKTRTPQDILEMEKALENKQLEIISRKAHKIAGSLGVLQFKSGFALAKEIERVAKQETMIEIEPKVNSLITYLRNALSEI